MWMSTKPALAQQLGVDVGRREAERAAQLERVSGHRLVAVLHQRPHHQGHPLVLVGSTDHRVGHRASGADDTPELAEGRGGIGDEHESQPGDGGVDGIVVEVECLRVHHPAVDVGEPVRARSPTSRVDHRRCEVGGDDRALGSDGVGDQEARLSGPGGHIEDDLPRLRIDGLDQPLRRSPEEVEDPFAVRLPCLGDRLPLVEVSSVSHATTPTSTLIGSITRRQPDDNRVTQQVHPGAPCPLQRSPGEWRRRQRRPVSGSHSVGFRARRDPRCRPPL